MTASNLRLLVGGLKSLVSPRVSTPPGALPDSARYGYAVWLRHLALVAAADPAFRPGRVVELGPGPSLAASLAALLSGAERGWALDEVPLASPASAVRTLDELVALFSAAAPIPDSAEFPRLQPVPPSFAFPETAIPPAVRQAALAPARLDRLREGLRAGAGPDAPLYYQAPWRADAVPAGGVDLVFSQAVLQELRSAPDSDELERGLRQMHAWLRPGGYMSHQIDLSSGYGAAWNEHWTLGELGWRVARGRRPSWINREPLSGYLTLCRACGFAIVAVHPVRDDGGVPPARLARRYRALPAQDYVTRSVHLVVRRD